MMQDLKDRFIELYHEWFANKHYWFDKKPEHDKYLSDKYFNDIQKITEYTDNVFDHETNCIEIKIGAIIAFDQIPRHYNRIHSIDCNKHSVVAQDISLCLMRQLSQNKELYDSISAYEWCFILLPIRHLQDIYKVLGVIHFIIQRHNNDDTCDEDRKIYKRYLENTIRKIFPLNTDIYLQEQKDIHKIAVNKFNQWDKYSYVLHHNPIGPIQFEMKKDPVFDAFSKESKYIKNQNIFVSLSGGVDSCVLLYLVKQLLPYNNIFAVHINYNNRYECEDELKFVRKYCAVLNVKLFYRTINEIHRNDCHLQGLRSLYESITREIRMDMYTRTVKILGLSLDDCLIGMGHNKDDGFENIITNISLKNNYENLSGFSRFSKIDSIPFWRPLLALRKHEIVSFAMHMNIPFLCNSTPEWSARGKIRDVVLPALQNINPDIMTAFFDLKDYVQSTDDIVTRYVVPVLLNKFLYDTEHKHIKGCMKYDDMCDNISVWIKVFQEKMFMTFFEKRISHKSLVEFVEFSKRFMKNFDSAHVNKKVKYVLNSSTYVSMHKNPDEEIVICFTKK
jgi:tRNA(Ile)-lysidine synthetase-like protein